MNYANGGPVEVKNGVPLVWLDPFCTYYIPRSQLPNLPLVRLKTLNERYRARIEG